MDSPEPQKILDPEFEEVKYVDPKTCPITFDIYKSPDWDRTIPILLEQIDSCKGDGSYGDYPYFHQQDENSFTPQLSHPSEILNTQQLQALHHRLPYYIQNMNLKRVFSISVDGCAMKTFYDKCNDVNNSILVVKDDENNIFGAYATEMFEPTGKFYGTGECFLFTFYRDNKIHVFNSTGENDFYMFSDENQICFGCSDDYFSLSLRNNFLEGYSKMTQTYKNQPLNGVRKDKFIVVKLELWTFQQG